MELNPRAKIYMQNNAGGEYYAFDGEEQGFRYIGIDKKILTLPQVQLLKDDTKIDDELQIFTVDQRAYPLPSTNKRLRELCDGQYIQDEFHHEQNLLLIADGKKILFCGCAHNGILNVMETLERKFGPASLPDLVIGGFHLMKRTEFSEADTAEVTEIANRLKGYKSHFATCHCTGLPVFNQMKEIMGDQLSYVHSGDKILLYPQIEFTFTKRPPFDERSFFYGRVTDYFSASITSCGRCHLTAMSYGVSPEMFFSVLSIPMEISFFTVSAFAVFAA